MQRALLFVAVAIAIAAFFAFDLDSALTLQNLQQQQAQLAEFQAQHPWRLAALYFVIYVVVTALSLPGATLLTLAGGAVFGFELGLLLVSFASSIGATGAFLTARFLLRNWVQRRFGDRLEAINAGLENDGGFYLFSLRLVPLFPFFVINLVMGLTPIRTRTFYWVSQLGMLAGTAVYVNAGTQLAQLDGLGGILSPSLIVAFVLLGLFPLLARQTLNWLRRRRENESA
ncbi:TVP38/TMEM64 family protein [Saccharospirillum mangrovi]|uniref:TVP38/TMEM64 family protein n=1 Tax=Saccharospirillum mangrovi TaxID=2161747 RepID=UPI000D3B4906|nr:TVP38/TMEM64 family protein [Saccharospirillum mangrovi]